VHQAPTQIRSCRNCGNPVAHDHASDLFCSACQRARCTYDPRHDPGFGETLLALLKANPGRPIHVHRELGIEHCGLAAWRCVQVHMRRLRRHGHIIVGCHDGTYEYLGRGEAHRSGRARGRRRPAG
jgi:hypothetical protein